MFPYSDVPEGTFQNLPTAVLLSSALKKSSELNHVDVQTSNFQATKSCNKCEELNLCCRFPGSMQSKSAVSGPTEEDAGLYI